MSRQKKKQRKEELKTKSIHEWRDFFNEKFNPTDMQKAMLLYTWYLGDSDLLTQAYVEAAHTIYASSVEANRNSKTYFWNVASQEADVKRTHSGLPKAIIKTLINILSTPSSKVMVSKANDDGKLDDVEDEADTNRLIDILDDNDFENLTKQQQEPMTWVMGDGTYLVNVLNDVSNMPVIEYVDARNTAYDIKSNRVVKVYTRSYYIHGEHGYCLLQERGTTDYEGSKAAYVKYNLFTLQNVDSREIGAEIPLDSIEETFNLKPMVVYKTIDEMLAVPCIYDYEAIKQRGTSIYNEKMDLFDDLDQCLSQDANSVRLSTPVETIDSEMLESDNDGNIVPPKRYDRRYVTVRSKVNSVGENGCGIVSNIPQIDFSRYSNEALAITSQILTGIISPCTIGADVSKKDNAEAQREKEKQTMFTRNALIKLQTSVFERLFRLVLKVDDYMSKEKPQDYKIVIDYEEYGNPTFDAKLQSLYPAFVAGALSPEQYVKELWGDSLTDKEKDEEIAYLTEKMQTGMSLAADDPFANLTDGE